VLSFSSSCSAVQILSSLTCVSGLNLGLENEVGRGFRLRGNVIEVLHLLQDIRLCALLSDTQEYPQLPQVIRYLLFSIISASSLE
ncbi:MAG: hypothetical protein ACRD4B_01430, partial [Acidobacteriota bacterium]